MDKRDVLLINKHYNTPGVYCLTYDINGHKYIGSSVNIGLRVWNGLLDYNNVVSNINLEYLSFSILETTDKKHVPTLRYLEYKWIEKLNTKYPYGMNISCPLNDFGSKSSQPKTNITEKPLIKLRNEELKDYLEKYRISCSATKNQKPKKRKNRELERQRIKSLLKTWETI